MNYDSEFVSDMAASAKRGYVASPEATLELVEVIRYLEREVAALQRRLNDANVRAANATVRAVPHD